MYCIGLRRLTGPQCTSGVDPLSRRALWKILSSVRHERTVVFTTHVSLFLECLFSNLTLFPVP